MKTLHYKSAAPLRLDKFILAEEPGLPLALLHKYLRQNKIKVNGKRVPLATRLAAGDEVTLYLPESLAAKKPQEERLAVLFEDENLLAVFKPAGLLAMEESGQGRDNLLDRARRYTAARGGGEVLPCHRIDTGTSGVLLMAKNEAALEFVTGLMHDGALEKTYYGLCFGHPRPARGTVEAALCKDALTGTVRTAAPGQKGAKPALTEYETLATCGELALLRLVLHTGRTHQIRAHMASLGTPLLGDSKYGSVAANRRFKCKYQCLCAQSIRFPALKGTPFDAYNGLAITCEKPWFYQKTLAQGWPQTPAGAKPRKQNRK